MSATFRNVPLSTSFDPALEHSALSLEWVLSSGICSSGSSASGLLSLPCGDGSLRSMNVKLCISPSDLVLGRTWMAASPLFSPMLASLLALNMCAVCDVCPLSHNSFASAQASRTLDPTLMDIDADTQNNGQDVDSATSMTATVLELILEADENKISTESLCHVASALNIGVSGPRNLRFRLKAALRGHLKLWRMFAETLQSILSPVTAPSILMHIYPSLPPHEANKINPDIQVHILTAIHASKTSPNAMRCLLNTLNIEHNPLDSIKIYRKLRSYLLTLRKGKREEQAKVDYLAHRVEQLEKIHETWPQLVPQTLKDKIINLFREMTSFKALSSFTCASCAEAVPLRSHCSLSAKDFDLNNLKRPDRSGNEELLLDRYKWLHPDCVPLQMPFDECEFKDVLVDPDGVTFPPDAALVLSLCSELAALSLANKLFLVPIPEELKDLTVIEEAI
ncbi:hypothetical protein C8R45DRAFT_923332 [Mycena sanguinolenta]|nr:hypothetical protein C8R45DRAFT_923332 [Mycena sanguinolenta]